MSSAWAESVLSWWEEAGVDTLAAETPRDWLNERPRAAIPAAPTPPAPAAEAPETLEAFRAWFTDATHLPLGAPGAPRLGPGGDPASGLMVVVDMPAPEDFAGGRLLAGEAGALFDKMLGAIGRARETIYLASLSPLRTPTGTLDANLSEQLAALARRHIALVQPRALLLFGDACSKALVGPAVAGARGRWHELATPSGPVKTLVTIRPEKLLAMPKLKSHAWADLQLLMEALKP